MKRVDAFIDPTHLSTIREELKKLAIQSFWVRPCTTIGHSPGAKLFYRSVEITDSATREFELTLVVADEQLRPLVRVLEAHAAGAEVLVSSIESCHGSAPAVRPLLTSVG